MKDAARAPSKRRGRRFGWVSRGVIGIVLATFFSDVGHEMATATLPLYLGSIGLGAAALGFVEGFADLVLATLPIRTRHVRPLAGATKRHAALR